MEIYTHLDNIHKSKQMSKLDDYLSSPTDNLEEKTG